MKRRRSGSRGISWISSPPGCWIGWGRVVNIASAVIFLGPPELVAYTTAKAGLVGFTRALASAVGAEGITVNAIAPGLTRPATAVRTTGADGGFERVRALQVVPRTAEPAQPAIVR